MLEKSYTESNMGCYSYVDFFLYLLNDQQIMVYKFMLVMLLQ